MEEVGLVLLDREAMVVNRWAREGLGQSHQHCNKDLPQLSPQASRTHFSFSSSST